MFASARPAPSAWASTGPRLSLEYRRLVARLCVLMAMRSCQHRLSVDSMMLWNLLSHAQCEAELRLSLRWRWYRYDQPMSSHTRLMSSQYQHPVSWDPLLQIPYCEMVGVKALGRIEFRSCNSTK